MNINNLLTASGVAAGTCTPIMAQSPALGDKVGIWGALIALLLLTVRTINELGKAYYNYKQSQLANSTLQERVNDLERLQHEAAARCHNHASGEPCQPDCGCGCGHPRNGSGGQAAASGIRTTPPLEPTP